MATPCVPILERERERKRGREKEREREREGERVIYAYTIEYIQHCNTESTVISI